MKGGDPEETGPGRKVLTPLPTKVKRSTGGRTQQIRLRLSPTFPRILAMGESKTTGTEGENHSQLTAQCLGHLNNRVALEGGRGRAVGGRRVETKNRNMTANIPSHLQSKAQSFST